MKGITIGYDPDCPKRAARKAFKAQQEYELQQKVDGMQKVNCDNCREAQMTDGKAIGCKLRQMPVNGSCPEYSRRLELFK